MSAPAPGAASAGDEPPELATDGACPPLLPNPQPCSSPPRRTLVSPRALLCSKRRRTLRRRTFAPGSFRLGPRCTCLAAATASGRPWGAAPSTRSNASPILTDSPLSRSEPEHQDCGELCGSRAHSTLCGESDSLSSTTCSPLKVQTGNH
jgi:hypothetical protein